MHRTRGIAVASFAVLLAVAGCSRLGANAGYRTDATPVSQDQAITQIEQTVTRDATTRAATETQVLALVQAAADTTKVPSTLADKVGDATNDGPEAAWDGCLAEETDTQVGDNCVYGDKNAKKTVVLYGDSHAGMWEWALDVAGKRDHWRLVLLAKPACAVPMLHFWLETTQRQNTECDAWHVWATDKIVSLRPDLVVLTSLFTGPRDFGKRDITEEQWSQGMTAAIDKVKKSGAKVVVLGDMPYLEQSAPECLAAHPDDVKPCATNAATAVNATHGADEKQTADTAGAKYVDTTKWFCTDVCEPLIGDMVVYQNQYHITGVYSRYLSGVVASSIGMSRT
jgi:ABC-type Fe3+-hydroxamate transport system substrate-binding protein